MILLIDLHRWTDFDWQKQFATGNYKLERIHIIFLDITYFFATRYSNTNVLVTNSYILYIILEIITSLEAHIVKRPVGYECLTYNYVSFSWGNSLSSNPFSKMLVKSVKSKYLRFIIASRYTLLTPSFMVLHVFCLMQGSILVYFDVL